MTVAGKADGEVEWKESMENGLYELNMTEYQNGAATGKYAYCAYNNSGALIAASFGTAAISYYGDNQLDEKEAYEIFMSCMRQEGYFFRRDYNCEIINYDLFTNEPRLSQVFFFDNYTDYFVFLFLKFAEQKRRVLECPCCGKLFVPKSNRAEIYCDRVLIDGKTCKQIAPKLARKLKQRNDPLLEEYEKAKNRNYKRVERYENADGNSGVMRLTFNE